MRETWNLCYVGSVNAGENLDAGDLELVLCGFRKCGDLELVLCCKRETCVMWVP